MIKTPIDTDRQLQLRKVAILVSTLDGPLAVRLLAELPAREADAVEKMIPHLGDIEPAEYRAVAADFRQGITAPPSGPAEPPQQEMNGVELDESLLARLEADEMTAEESSVYHPAVAQSTGPWQTMNDTDTTTLVEMLSAEQPQTIAVVISRLETAQAAELLGKFPSPLQAEILTRLANLDPADEQALQVVESQLADWIHQQRQQRQRMAAGRDLVQRILQSSPNNQRVALLAQLGKQNPSLAESLSQTQPDNSQSTAGLTPTSFAANQAAATRTTTTSPYPTASSAANRLTSRLPAQPKMVAEAANPVADPLSKLESLDDDSLLRALRLADRQTVMLALAGASDGLMKRIVRGLPRRRANQFRQQIRAIGPTRLSDMLEAQHKLVRCSQAK